MPGAGRYYPGGRPPSSPITIVALVLLLVILVWWSVFFPVTMWTRSDRARTRIACRFSLYLHGRPRSNSLSTLLLCSRLYSISRLGSTASSILEISVCLHLVLLVVSLCGVSRIDLHRVLTQLFKASFLLASSRFSSIRVPSRLQFNIPKTTGTSRHGLKY